jgi:hypothetical protein
VNKIIEIAKQAGFENCNFSPIPAGNSLIFLETFSKLIAEKEREKILAVLRRKPDQQIYKVLDEIRGMK